MFRMIPKVNAKKVQGITQHTLYYEVTILWVFKYNTQAVAFYGCEVTESL